MLVSQKNVSFLSFGVVSGCSGEALAAGCPVVVKGHSAHPGTGEIVADAIAAAIEPHRCTVRSRRRRRRRHAAAAAAAADATT